MVWGSNQNYYTIGPTPYVEDHTVRENDQPVLDLRCDHPCWHCGGKRACFVPPSACLPLDDLCEQKTSSMMFAGTWLMGVFPSQGCLVGFVHGEDHYKVQRKRGLHTAT